mgnify:CR=1 FL=1
MATADILSTLILISGTLSGVLFIIATIRYKQLRFIFSTIALGSLGLALIFGLNSLHIVANASGITGGRPWTIITLSGIVGLGFFYAFGSKARLK